MTPITLNGWFLTRMICPVGSTSGAEQVVGRPSVPSTQTLLRCSTSCGVKKLPYFVRPVADQREVDVGALNLGRPVLVAGDELRARVDARGDVLHARHRCEAPPRRPASASWTLPPPWRTPPCEKLPALMVIRFVPAALTCSSIVDCAPLPSATIVMTAPTPMIMPEHRQHGAHLVAVERLQRDPQRHEDRHVALLDHAAEVLGGHIVRRQVRARRVSGGGSAASSCAASRRCAIF